MATIELFLDEAGYTGPDLINREQPVFTLASTNIAEAEARSLLTSCFGIRQGEVKFATRAGSSRGLTTLLADAKRKLKEWGNYDIASVEQCVMEFDRADEKGFAFRYAREGGELCRFDFAALDHQMDHLRQVLDGIWTCLYEMRAEIAEYERELQAEFGNDMYW
jgi:hypothetical protein